MHLFAKFYPPEYKSIKYGKCIDTYVQITFKKNIHTNYEIKLNIG